MQVNRRGFLVLTSAVVGAMTVNGSASADASEPVRTLWGDGRHDDTLALRDLFGGRSVAIARPGRFSAMRDTSGRVTLIAGKFRHRASFRQTIRNGSHIVLQDNLG